MKKRGTWKNIAPYKMSERRTLRNNCGDNCFLLPDSLKFPICKKTQPCEVSCLGIDAALKRSAQWGYKKVNRTAKRLKKRLCKIEKQ
jgi:hypothetical protein